MCSSPSDQAASLRSRVRADARHDVGYAQVQHRCQQDLRVPAGPHVRQQEVQAGHCLVSQQPSTKPRSGSGSSGRTAPTPGATGSPGSWAGRSPSASSRCGTCKVCALPAKTCRAGTMWSSSQAKSEFRPWVARLGRLAASMPGRTRRGLAGWRPSLARARDKRQVPKTVKNPDSQARKSGWRLYSLKTDKISEKGGHEALFDALHF